MIIISEKKYKEDLIDYANHILFAKLDDIPNLINDVINNYDYYYKLLDIDNIDYKRYDNFVDTKIFK